MEEEDRLVKKLERGGHGEAFERKIEAMRKDFERQRDEDIREWGRKFEGLEEVVRRQKNELEEI